MVTRSDREGIRICHTTFVLGKRSGTRMDTGSEWGTHVNVHENRNTIACFWLRFRNVLCLNMSAHTYRNKAIHI
jgi:hypothetical protein